MNSLECNELYLLLDSEGAIISYQENVESWAGALAFSSEERASDFLQTAKLQAAEIVAIDTQDQKNLQEFIAALKRRPIRYLLLDLDYRTGSCRQVDFDGDSLGAVRERQFVAARTDRR